MNVTSVSFEGCGKTTKVVPARVTNILSVPEFICDAYLSVIRPIVVDSLVRHGIIEKNAALDKILQSKPRRCAGYIGIVGRNLLSFPLSFLNYIPALNGGVSSVIMSAVPIAVCVAQTVYDALRVGRWLWHRRNPEAMYRRYSNYIGRLNRSSTRLNGKELWVVKEEKARVYAKMFNLLKSNPKLRGMHLFSENDRNDIESCHASDVLDDKMKSLLGLL